MPDAVRPIELLPEHLAALATAQPTGLVGARIYRAGRFDEAGFTLYGQLEFLANCGLVEFIAQAGKSYIPPGDVWMYYYLTEQGRVLLKWRAGLEPVGPIERAQAGRRANSREDARSGAASH